MGNESICESRQIFICIHVLNCMVNRSAILVGVLYHVINSGNPSCASPLLERMFSM